MALSLIWESDLNFHAGPGGPAMALASSDPERVSPMQALAYAIMGCMAMDVVHILQKGRHDLKGLTVDFASERNEHPPKYYTKVLLTFNITGAIPTDAVERAIALSHEKYCSVSNTLRKDLIFETRVNVSA